MCLPPGFVAKSDGGVPNAQVTGMQCLGMQRALKDMALAPYATMSRNYLRPAQVSSADGTAVITSP
jgi:hypothetical protein